MTVDIPAMVDLARERDAIAAVLGGTVEVTPVPIPGDRRDGFEGAYWRWPHAILDPAVWRGISILCLIPHRDRRHGMRDLAVDLDSGPLAPEVRTPARPE